MKKAILMLVAIVCFVCVTVGLVACNQTGTDMSNLSKNEQCAKVLNAFIDYFIPQQTATQTTTAKRRSVTSAEGAEITVDDILTKTLQPSTYDGAQRLSLPLTYSYFLTKLCENENFVIGDKPVAFVATETPGYPMTCIVYFSYDETADKLTLYLYDGRALMYGEIYYDEQNDTVKDFLLHGNKIGASAGPNGIDYYEYVTIQRKGNALKEGDSYYYPANGNCLLQGVAQDKSAQLGEWHVGLLDDILDEFTQKAENKDTLTTDFGAEMRATSLFARNLHDRLLNSGNAGNDDDNNGGNTDDNDNPVVTIDQWNQALDASEFLNFTANWTITGDSKEYSAVVDLVNFKYMFFDSDNNYTYYSDEGKSYYKYVKSNTDSKFTKYEISEDTYTWSLKGTESTLVWEVIDSFGDFKYDTTNKCYVGENISIGEMGECDFVLSFNNGKLLSADIGLDNNAHLIVHYTYNDARVTLPTDFVIDDGGDDPQYIPIENIYFNEKEMQMMVGENIKAPINIEPYDATDTVLKWESSNPSVADVDAKGNVQSYSVGNAIITATTGNGLTASISVRVEPIPDDNHDEPISITIDATHLEMRVNDVHDLDANILPITASTAVKWSSTNPSVATVDEKGVVTALEEGTTTIIVVTDNGLTDECTVTVSGVNDEPKDIPVENILISTEFIDLRVGESASFTVTVFPENATNKNFHIIGDGAGEFLDLMENGDGSYTIRALKEGSTTIQAVADSNAIFAQCTVNIRSIVDHITLNTQEINLNLDESATITVTYEPFDANIILHWYLFDSGVATIESFDNHSCTVRATAQGDTTLFLSYFLNDGSSIEVGSCHIFVNASQTSFVGKAYNCYDIASGDISPADLESLRPMLVNDLYVYFTSDTTAEIDQKNGFGHAECTYTIDANVITFTITFCMTNAEVNPSMVGQTLLFYVNRDGLTYSDHIDGKGTVTYLLCLQN